MFPKYKSQCPSGGADRKASQSFPAPRPPHLAFILGGGGSLLLTSALLDTQQAPHIPPRASP